MRSGLHVVIAGQPNVGKSSLLNQLAGDEVAIVTPIAGTTRDTVRQIIELEGVPVHIIDTAGLRDPADELERLGIARTWSEIERSDVLLLVVDARLGMSAVDEAIVARVENVASALPRIVIHNKVDLSSRAAGRDGAHLFLSAKTGEGIDLLRQALLERVGWHPGEEDLFMARERHLQALARAQARLCTATEAFAQTELLAEELRLAQQELNLITGEFGADDLLGEIFSRFCIGK